MAVGIDGEAVPILEGGDGGDPRGQFRAEFVGPWGVPFGDEERLAFHFVVAEAVHDDGFVAEHGVRVEEAARLRMVPVGVRIRVVELGEGEEEACVARPVGACHRDFHADFVAEEASHFAVVFVRDMDEELDHRVVLFREIDLPFRQIEGVFGGPFAVHGFEARAVRFERDFLRPQVVFIGELHHGESGIILVGDFRVGIYVRPEVSRILLLKFDEPAVEIAVRFRADGKILRVVHAVAFLEGAVDQLVEIDVDAFAFEAVHQIIEFVQIDRIEGARVVRLLVEEAVFAPLRVRMMGADDVDAVGGEASGDEFGLFMRGEVRACGEARPPEADGLAVSGSDELTVLYGDEAMLSGWLVVEEGDVQRGGRVPRKRVGEPFGRVRDGRDGVRVKERIHGAVRVFSGEGNGPFDGDGADFVSFLKPCEAQADFKIAGAPCAVVLKEKIGGLVEGQQDGRRFRHGLYGNRFDSSAERRLAADVFGDDNGFRAFRRLAEESRPRIEG